MKRNSPTTDRIVDSSMPEPNSGCWLWTKGTDKDGYGRIQCHGKNQQAHRISFSVFKSNPDNLFVCHKCDTPSCVNPDHLFVGTSADNTQDALEKLRLIDRNAERVTLHRQTGKWQAAYAFNRKQFYVGLFESKIIAISTCRAHHEKTVREFLNKTTK